MTTLQNVASGLVAELSSALVESNRSEIADQINRGVVDRCTGAGDDDMGYIYLVRPGPSSHSRSFVYRVAETISFYSSLGLNVDIDHDGNVFGIEFIGRSDITAALKAANAL